ncbi:hypothetical protein [Citricoccus muralis]|uniref:Uncharacterized protein n=1 Tax=Citricoccus muralis TaxID=169134 RepID=A0ABY8H4T3_9MICC|nr:hypothetical protein [Citricoccus muralis]WFP16021.1 hypothetical protein P8192_11555 [Citricoccus muralis]
MSRSASSTPDDPGQPESPTPSDPTQLVLRRAPRLSVFLIGGALLGVIAALILNGTQEPNPDFVEESALGFFMVTLAVPGLALGALAWLLVDRRSKKRARTVYAEPTTDYDNADFALGSTDLDELRRQSRERDAEQ